MSGGPVLRAGHACQPGRAGVAAKTGAQGLSGPSAGGSFPACAASLPTQTVHSCKALDGGSRELQRLWSRFGFEAVMRTQCGKDARIQISGSTGSPSPVARKVKRRLPRTQALWRRPASMLATPMLSPSYPQRFQQTRGTTPCRKPFRAAPHPSLAGPGGTAA